MLPIEKGKDMTIQRDRTKFGYLLTNRIIKRAGLLLLAVALIAQPFGTLVSALQVINYTNTAFTPAEVSTNWFKDRTLPSGNYGSVGFGDRTNVLEMNVDKNITSPLGEWYWTEGLQRDIPNSDGIKADVYVDSSWTGKKVRAGLWGVGNTQTGALSDSYPIIEFTTDGYTGWRVWDATVGWVSLPGIAYNTDGWNTVAIKHNDANDTYTFGVNGTDVKTIQANVATDHFGAAILNSRNYALDNYNVHWSNFAYGSYDFVAEIPTNAKFTNPSVCGGATNQKVTVATWSPVVDAASYVYKVWKDGDAKYGSFNSAYTVNVSGTSQPGEFNIGEGIYRFAVQAIYANGEKSGWSTPCSATYDTTAPASTTLVSPGNGSIVNGASLTQKWNASTSSDVHHYVYESYNDAAAASLRWSQNVSGTSKTATGVADTTYWWRVKAVDAASNQSSWSPLWKLTVDNIAPVVNIIAPTEGEIVRGLVNVVGAVTDANPQNSYFLITGPNNYSKPSFFGDGRKTHEYNWDTTNVPQNGTYTIKFEAKDKAGNKDPGSVKTIKVEVNNPLPTLDKEDFGVGSWTIANNGFTGFNVGFSIHDFKTVSNMTVDLYNKDGKIDTNTASSALLTMVNAGDSKVLPSLSTPFVTQGNLIDDWCNGSACWNMGGYEWESKDKIPAKAVITVVGTDVYGKPVIKTVENTQFSEAAGEYTTILPHLIFLPAPVGQTPAANNVGGNNEQAATVRNVTPTVRVNTPAEPEVVVVEDDEQGEVLGASTDKTAVLAATDTAADEDEQPQASNKGVAGWVWWTSGGGAALTGAWWALAALRRRE